MKEIFKEIDWLKGIYEVSNKGRVKSLARTSYRSNGRILIKKERIMTNSVNFFGYETVYLNKKRYPVHRLVAIHFLVNENSFPEVNHIDGNKKNNNVENLEWCNRSFNLKHAYKTGLKVGMKGDKNPMYGISLEGRKGEKHHAFGKVGKDAPRSIPIVQLDRNMVILNTYESINRAAILNGFCASNITS
ncbi:MAG: NUMOD4 domain-containing protein, partial [Janthinobacterium sp.]